jgi:Domain of Unknown Function (DUF1080)
MKFSRRGFIKSSGYSIAAACLGCYDISRDDAWPVAAKSRVIKLFNGHNLDGWYTFLHSRDRNSDPEGIFKVADKTIHVLGKEFGYLSTTAEYDNFHLTAEFKWGEKRFPPREKAKRDSGILYRFPLGQEDKVWPRSIECQIQEGDCGDFWPIGGATIVGDGVTQTRYFQKKRDAEKPTGEWNKIEIIADGGKCSHLVNGVLVNEATEASVTKGKILLQSEGAEVFYRKVELIRK